MTVGCKVGVTVGVTVGRCEGLIEGWAEGAMDGTCVGRAPPAVTLSVRSLSAYSVLNPTVPEAVQVASCPMKVAVV
jgi:hypothetical protein